MLFAIISQDVNDSLEKRLPVREQHLARLQLLENEGRLILAGPHPLSDSEDSQPPGFSGSLIVAEFINIKAAQKWADQDPYVAAGVYAAVQVKPFLQVFPKSV